MRYWLAFWPCPPLPDARGRARALSAIPRLIGGRAVHRARSRWLIQTNREQQLATGKTQLHNEMLCYVQVRRRILGDMKKFILLTLPAAFLSLGACSTYGYGYDDYGYGYSDYGYGYDSYGYGSGPYYGGSGTTIIWHDAYYDNFYGPIIGGYWDVDGYFWYQSRSNGPYLRDYGRHFRRDHFSGGSRHRYQDHRGNHGDRDRNTYPPLFSGQQNDRDRGRDDRGRDNNRRGNDGIVWSDGRGRDNGQPRGNPPPGGRDRDGDRGRDNRGGRDNTAPPPLFGGQQTQQPRSNPPPQSQQPRGGQPPLDGGGRGDRGNDRGRDGPRGDNNNTPPPPLFGGQQQQQPRSNPPPQQQQQQSRPQQSGGRQPGGQPQGRGRGGDDTDGDRGRGGDRRRGRD